MKTNDILIAYDAAKEIIRDSRNFDVETGGILAGTLGNPITIVGAGGSGENSVHHSVQYTSDPEADRKCLENANRKYGSQILTAGWWHKHPSGFDRPSSGDSMQVQQLSREYNDGKPVLMGIVTRCPRSFSDKINLRIYSLNGSGELVEHSWKLVADTDKTLLKAINNAKAVPATKNSTFWTDPEFRFHLNPVGRARIIHERNQLKEAGWQVITGQRRKDKAFTMDLSDGTFEIRLVFPSEFPLNPPAVFVEEGRRLAGLNRLKDWNSLDSITSIVEESKNLLALSLTRHKDFTNKYCRYGGF